MLVEASWYVWVAALQARVPHSTACCQVRRSCVDTPRRASYPRPDRPVVSSFAQSVWRWHAQRAVMQRSHVHLAGCESPPSIRQWLAWSRFSVRIAPKQRAPNCSLLIGCVLVCGGSIRVATNKSAFAGVGFQDMDDAAARFRVQGVQEGATNEIVRCAVSFAITLRTELCGSTLNSRKMASFMYKDYGASQDRWSGCGGVLDGEGIRVLVRPPDGSPALIATVWKPTNPAVRDGLAKLISAFDEEYEPERAWVQVTPHMSWLWRVH